MDGSYFNNVAMLFSTFIETGLLTKRVLESLASVGSGLETETCTLFPLKGSIL